DSLYHEGERQRMFARAKGISVELELAAVGGERRPEGKRMALRAGKSRLTCEAGHGARTLREREQREANGGQRRGRGGNEQFQVRTVDEGKQLPTRWSAEPASVQARNARPQPP